MSECKENMSQESNVSSIGSFSQNPVWGLIHKCTIGEENSILFAKPKYVFGNLWMSQYDVSREQYVEFVKEEFKIQRYFNRISNYQFYISREDIDDIRPAIICNLSEKFPLFIINGSEITKVTFCEQRILRHGDHVAVSPMKDGYLFKFIYTHAMPFGLSLCPSIESKYFIGSQIGSGGTADVLLVSQIKMTNGVFGQRALKVVHKNAKLTNQKIIALENDRVMREITAMQNFNSYHVLRLMDFLNTKDHLFMVLPYMGGGNLVDRITKYYAHPYLDEDMARFFFRQLLIGIKHMHERGWVHRDIKPDNLLLSDNSPFPILVIGDLGLSKVLGEDNTICGTSGYSAPELIQKNKHYDNKVDSWSCGIVLFSMLSGNMPFHESYKRHLGIGLDEQVIAANVMFRHDGFQNVSQSAKLLINSLLQRDAEKRWDLALSIKHKWVSNELTEQMIKRAYAANGISIKEIEESMQNVAVTDHSEAPEAKRRRY